MRAASYDPFSSLSTPFSPRSPTFPPTSLNPSPAPLPQPSLPKLPPAAGCRFVIKTQDTATGDKVFINVCSSTKVPAPGSGWANGTIPDEVRHIM